MGPDAIIFVFFEASFFTLLFPFQEALQFLFAFCHKGGVICILKLLIFFPAMLIPACASSSPAFLMMYSAHTLNKQGDNMQPWCIPFPIWNQSVVPCSVLTVASWPAYLQISQEAGQVVWYSHLFKNFPQFVVIHTVRGFGIVNKAEVDVFLELSYFVYVPMDVGNLISGSSAFSKCTWTSGVHVSCTVEAWLGESWALLY